ncbi:MAG: hypothetical protein AAF789_00585 [Bacteroidota bacterium]
MNSLQMIILQVPVITQVLSKQNAEIALLACSTSFIAAIHSITYQSA